MIVTVKSLKSGGWSNQKVANIIDDQEFCRHPLDFTVIITLRGDPPLPTEYAPALGLRQGTCRDASGLIGAGATLPPSSQGSTKTCQSQGATKIARVLTNISVNA